MSRCAATSLALFAVVLAAALPWHVRSASACSCAQVPMAERLQFTDTVFSGTATDVEKWDGSGSSGTALTILFAADHAWAGEVEPVVQVHTAASGASCGYTFEEGTRYVVLGKRTGDYVETGLCSLTQPYDRDVLAQFEPFTGPGRAVAPAPNRPGSRDDSIADPESAGGAWAFARVAAVGLTAVGVVGFLSTRRRV